jgi:hypothetical protein
MRAPENLAANKPYYGDILAVLRDYIPGQSVDLIYFDVTFKKAPRFRPSAAKNLTLNLTNEEQP